MVLFDLFFISGGLFTQPRDGADREPPYYPASYDFKLSIRSHARPRSRRLISFSLDATFADCKASCVG